jgi:hypothetical protein
MFINDGAEPQAASDQVLIPTVDPATATSVTLMETD